MNIYFHEVTIENYNRYVTPVLIELCNKYSNIEFNFFFIVDGLKSNQIEIDQEIIKSITFIKPKNVRKSVKEYPPSAFVCYAFRIPDIYWTMYFNKMGITTFQVQHGLYIEYFSRPFLALIHEIPKIFTYLLYSLRIILKSDYKVSTLKAIIKKDVKNVKKTEVVDKYIRSDHFLMWGEYWIEWFKTKLFYDDSTKYHICGSFDTHILNNKDQLIEADDGSVTYICQTLIEDGRLDFKEFEIFKTNLFNFAKSLDGQLFIKLHPRSQRELYSEFEELENVTITNKFPISSHYLGHYSTMLFLSNNLLKPCTVIEFEGHPTPHFFKEIASNLISSHDKIDIDGSTTVNIDNANYYSLNVKNPYEIIADVIINETKVV